MPESLENLDCESLGSTWSLPPSPGSPISPAHSLHRLDRKSSVRPYQTKDAYLYAMKEDLAVWFNDLYNTALTADNLLPNLQDGTFLCLHANNVKSYIEASSHTAPTDIPDILYRAGAKAGSFQARDNLANFINWVKHHLGVNDVLLFESDDLVLMKNEKNVVLCILEVARRGARYGMLAPMLVQFEQEIDELEQKIKRVEGRRNSQGSMSNDAVAANSDTDSDKASLDEWVQSVVRKCTCPKQFPLINVSRGKYRIGYTQNTVFVRILRNHVMIRVGGGWDTLEHYMDKHDPCRCLKPTTNDSLRRRTRHKTSSAKDSRQTNRDKSPMVNRTRSQSVSSLEIPDEQLLPMKTNRSGSADILSNDLLITRDESGRHSIDETSKTKESKSPPKSHFGISRNNNNQSPVKARHRTLKANKNKDVIARSSSPSHDLVRKWKDTFKAQSSKTPIKEANDSPSCDGDKKHFRKNSATLPSQRTRSYSRTRTSSCGRSNSRSRSCSRAATLSPSRPCKEKLEVKVALLASPRKDKRQSAQPTRIPGPVPHSSISNAGMISSTSTCNSMDSLKTI